MPIRIVSFEAGLAQPIELYDSQRASALPVLQGAGESRAYAVHFQPGGVIGPHPAGFDQLFVVVQGAGWVAGSNGERLEVNPLRAAFIPTGEIHSKGSDSGMVAFMLQATSITLRAPAA